MTIWVCSDTKKRLRKLWPINRAKLPIQDGGHQYVAIYHILLTSHYNIVNNCTIPSFFGIVNLLMILVVCFKVKVMHCVKARGHFKPAEVGRYLIAQFKLIYITLVHVSPPADAPHTMINWVVFAELETGTLGESSHRVSSKLHHAHRCKTEWICYHLRRLA